VKSILILRPQPGADATARRAGLIGLNPIVAPLFEIRPIAWTAPDPAQFDALLMTSANAARHGGQALASCHRLPLYAVGSATAEAARAAGFADVTAGEGDGAAVLDLALASGVRRVLHLVGRDHTLLQHGQIAIDRQIVYAAEQVAGLPSPALRAIEGGAIALLHSPRAAALFAGLIDAREIDRGIVAIAALSGAVLRAAGAGWNSALASVAPNDDALLAVAARLCNQGSDGRGRAGSGEDRA
jgi:uroporphyrinogen-III synthase